MVWIIQKTSRKASWDKLWFGDGLQKEISQCPCLQTSIPRSFCAFTQMKGGGWSCSLGVPWVWVIPHKSFKPVEEERSHLISKPRGQSWEWVFIPPSSSQSWMCDLKPVSSWKHVTGDQKRNISSPQNKLVCVLLSVENVFFLLNSEIKATRLFPFAKSISSLSQPKGTTWYFQVSIKDAFPSAGAGSNNGPYGTPVCAKIEE